MAFDIDHLIFKPADVDLSQSPLRNGDLGPTYVLGAFNPGMTRLPNGNLLLMVRIAEALQNASTDQHIHAIRWDPQRGYVRDPWDLAHVDVTDPRKFRLLGHQSHVMALTSLSWLLPVEIAGDGSHVVKVHYDRAIVPEREYQQYGVEDARISRIGNDYYMTTCSVSAERHSTTLYTSGNGLDWSLQGIILDHQNKDMLFFEGKIGDFFYALTRPLGNLYFAYPPDSPFEPGPSINLARSPDALHWRPVDRPMIRPRRGSTSVMRIGGGSPPILTPDGWLMLYHGVQPGTVVGVYRTFWALLDREHPETILEIHDSTPLLENRPDLSESLAAQSYLTGVVFTTGIAPHEDDYIVASGEDDLACRITRIPKAFFSRKTS